MHQVDHKLRNVNEELIFKKQTHNLHQVAVNECFASSHL